MATRPYKTLLKTSTLPPTLRHRLYTLESETSDKLRKQLKDAVCQSQGRSRGSYYAKDRPEWWNLDVGIDFGYGDIVVLPKFRSTGWKKNGMLAALAMYFNEEEIGRAHV